MGKPVNSTMETIDSFLDKFGGRTASVPGAYIPEENQAENSSTATYTVEEEELTDNTPVQENILGENQEKNTSATVKQTLKDLIKEKRYQEALVLIEAQNLNNTEKSIYFAHQIRFIKKLIALQKYQDKPRGWEQPSQMQIKCIYF